MPPNESPLRETSAPNRFTNRPWCGHERRIPHASMLKFLPHDLAELQTFYRIAALAAVAVIDRAALFLCQRHFDRRADE